MNNEWLLPSALFLPDLDEEMAHLDGFLACVYLASLLRLSPFFRAAFEALVEIQAAPEQMLAGLPGLTDSCFAHQRTGIQLPHFSHQRTCAPIWRLAGPTFPGGRG